MTSSIRHAIPGVRATAGFRGRSFSYAGEVTVGFMVDTALLDNPGAPARAYERELAGLCA